VSDDTGAVGSNGSNILSDNGSKGGLGEELKGQASGGGGGGAKRVGGREVAGVWVADGVDPEPSLSLLRSLSLSLSPFFLSLSLPLSPSLPLSLPLSLPPCLPLFPSR